MSTYRVSSCGACGSEILWIDNPAVERRPLDINAVTPEPGQLGYVMESHTGQWLPSASLRKLPPLHHVLHSCEQWWAARERIRAEQDERRQALLGDRGLPMLRHVDEV